MDRARSDSAALSPLDERNTTWWDENGASVEARFISMLKSEQARKDCHGFECSSPTALVLPPEDAALAFEQARRCGVPFEDHALRLFHEAVAAEQSRLQAYGQSLAALKKPVHALPGSGDLLRRRSR